MSLNDTVIQQETLGGDHGRGLAIGDVNGDGVLDVAVSDPSFGLLSRAWVLTGPAFDSPQALAIPDLAAWDLFPGQGDPFLLQDLTGDGLDDLLMASRWSTAGGEGNLVGRVLIAIAPEFTEWIELVHPLPGQAIEFGASAAIEDFTGDGIADLAIGSPRAPGSGGAPSVGRIDVYDGTMLNRPAVLTLQPDLRAQFLDSWGWVALAQDWSGDGSFELLINDRPEEVFGPGYSWIGPGGDAGLSPWKFSQNSNFCTNELAADLDGDGIQDLVVSDGDDTVALAFGPDFKQQRFFEAPPNDSSVQWGDGLAVGDVNRDGALDLLIGAPELDDSSGSNAVGLLRIYFGPDFDTFQGFWGAHEFAQFGIGVRTADVNGDGFDEVFVGAGSENGGSLHLLQHQTLRVIGASELSVSSGGSIEYSLEVGSLGGLQQYLVVLSASGSTPGVTFGGLQGVIHIPINPDGLTDYSIAAAGTPQFDGFLGITDLEGNGTPKVVLKPTSDPNLVGLTISAAGVLFNQLGALDYATNVAEFNLIQ